MNYLGHFYFNHKILPPEGPLFHFGAALPDLLSSFDRGYRLRMRPVKRALGKKPRHPLWRGIENHLIFDGLFHKSIFFAEMSDVLNEGLKRVPDHENRRKFFLAHIGCELLLDHCLLLDSPAVCTSFYQTLADADTSDGFAELRDHFDHPMRGLNAFMEKFMKIRFVSKYYAIPNLVEGINRMLTRTGQQPFSLAERKVFEIALEEARPQISARIESLSAEFRDKGNSGQLSTVGTGAKESSKANG